MDDTGYRQYLRGVVGASAAPYGYTLTVWTTGAIAMHAHGALPSSVDALLFLAGAISGFGIVSAYAFGINGSFSPGPRGEIRTWGGMHLPSVGLSIALATAMSEVVDGWLIWPLVGFTATTTYLLVTGLQFKLARHPDQG